MPSLRFSPEAAGVLDDLQGSKQMTNKLKKVRKALGFLETNPRHPGLQTHKYETVAGPDGRPLFEAYVENNTPSAWRIFFVWTGDDEITVVTIGPHP